ncbi:hypothetical protein I306_05197 [Cryptococcus gattii EJB2]|uniref:Peptidase A2 domain-containing protein n=1 Tax=Cryptococcus gattii EJB2 TaxID=1296103 RepID=A0ABR5BQW8_9TREE|nr:hypothetical protein I306_05197 [Cryptococcus gattii EJB2]
MSQSSLAPLMMPPQFFTMLIASTTSSTPIPSSRPWTIPSRKKTECAGLLAWVDNVGQMMETNGESNWDEWVAEFKDAALPLEWAISEQRSLHRLQFATAREWPAFNAQATQHWRNLMGTDQYPSDAQMALVYCAACPDSLYPHVKTKWAYKSGSLHEIRTLLELEVSKYMADKHNSPTVSRAKVSASTLTPSLLAHPATYYHDPKTPLLYYLSPAGKYLHELFAQENCCNDCRQVGHSYKTCPNHHSSVHSFTRLVEGYEVLIQELTSQLADLEMHLDKDHDLYTLFHPPLVIQVSAAADRHTPTAPPHPLRFLLDTGAGTSFFDLSVVAKLGWKVCKNAVECTVQLAGGKPGPVVRDVTGGSFRVRNAKYMVDGVVMHLNSTYDGILGLNFFKHYHLLDHSPLCHLLGHSGSAPKVNDIIVPMVTGRTPTSPDTVHLSALKSTKLLVITPPSTPVHLYAAETASYANVIVKLKSKFAEVFCRHWVPH